MKGRRAVFWPAVLFVFFLAGASLAGDLCTEPVHTESGLVRGMNEVENSTCVWLGIPYAAPPVGELRWNAPQLAPKWSGVKDANKYGDICMQKGLMAAIDSGTDSDMSEDCLYLNVWSPRKSGSFPVMVWIHGGGYTGGSGNTDLYRGDRLAEAGELVVVTINYRINIFGFLAHPTLREEDPNNSTGSYGSLDQVAALRWVHDNIESFGGDPDNVTIFGESAGGWSVCTMLATPLNKGVIHRAILESGGCEASAPLEKGYSQAAKSAQAVGCDAEDIDCLRAVPAKKLLNKATGGQLEGFVWVPHHDGHLLEKSPLKMIESGNYNKIPFLAGSNDDEFDAALKLVPTFKRKKGAKYEETMVRRFGISDEEARELAGLYPLSSYQNNSNIAFGRMLSDAGLGCPTYNGLATTAGQQDDTYYYRFTYDDFRFGKTIGAFHAMEIPYIFDSLDRDPIGLLYPKRKLAPAQELSRTIQGYWINFAKTGNPNGPGLPEWPEFEPDQPMVQILDLPVRAEASAMSGPCRFWMDYNQKHGVIFDDLRVFIK